MSSQNQNQGQSTGKRQEEKKPRTYRVQQSTVIELNRKHRDRRQRALVIKDVSFGLFGSKRYRSIYLQCSLNNFYDTLLLATILQRRVQGLAMIIQFEKVSYQLFQQGSDKGQDKEYSKFRIKLTREPSEQDKKDAGYHAPLAKQQLSQPITQVILWKRSNGMRRQGRGGNRNFRNNRGNNRRFRDEGDRQRDRDHNRNQRRGGDYRRQNHKVDQRDKRYKSKSNYEDEDRNQRYNRNRSNRDRDQRNGSKNYERRFKNDRDENQENTYKRGQNRSRGGSSGNNNRSNYNNDRQQNNNKRQNQYKKDKDREQDRGDRRPGRRRRYQDQDN